MGCQSITGNTPAFWQVSLSVCKLCWYQFILLGGERYCESKVSCPRTQHNDPGQGSNPDFNVESGALTTRPPHLPPSSCWSTNINFQPAWYLFWGSWMISSGGLICELLLNVYCNNYYNNYVYWLNNHSVHLKKKCGLPLHESRHIVWLKYLLLFN